MRTHELLVICGLVAACDERSTEERALEGQKLPVEDTNEVSVDPDPKPDPSVDNRNAPMVLHDAAVRLDLEEERSTLTRLIDVRMHGVDAAIDDLEKRGGAAAKDTVALLRARRDQARAKLSELGKTTQDNWVAYKRDVYDTWETLQHDVDEATR